MDGLRRSYAPSIMEYICGLSWNYSATAAVELLKQQNKQNKLNLQLITLKQFEKKFKLLKGLMVRNIVRMLLVRGFFCTDYCAEYVYMLRNCPLYS